MNHIMKRPAYHNPLPIISHPYSFCTISTTISKQSPSFCPNRIPVFLSIISRTFRFPRAVANKSLFIYLQIDLSHLRSPSSMRFVTQTRILLHQCHRPHGPRLRHTIFTHQSRIHKRLHDCRLSVRPRRRHQPALHVTRFISMNILPIRLRPLFRQPILKLFFLNRFNHPPYAPSDLKTELDIPK